MKISKSLVSRHWKNALEKILCGSKSTCDPVLIVRPDDPVKAHQMGQYLSQQAGAVYVRLGVSCSMHYLFRDILLQISSQEALARNEYHLHTMRVISARVKATGNWRLIAIDNCQHLVLDQISYLLGLISELEGRIQFILLLGDSYLDAWREIEKTGDPYLKYLLTIISKRYAIR